MSDARLILFLKAPRPGLVKTRLAVALGAEAACAAYRKLVETLLPRLGGLAGVELRFAPDDARRDIEPWLREGWRAAPQGPGDLGTRLARAMESAFAQGAKRVVVIGSDCPHVTTQDIADAWAALAGHDVALGPATDGGYWLIGLREPQPVLFTNIDWSTEKVLAQTLARADAAGLSVKLLRELADVDTPEDWRRFESRTMG